MSNKKIVLDLANGATYKIAPKLFKAFGAKVIPINDKPNGKNINRKSGTLHPEALKLAILKNKAHIGFAFDGDGDRIIAINKDGQIKDGDDLLAILSCNSDYKTCKSIIGTVMSNKALEDYFFQKNIKLIRSPVGDKNVLNYMTLHQTILGGEQSGHIILKNIINTSDGLLVALKILETLFQTNNWNLETYEKYPQILINVPIKKRKELTDPPLNELISSSEEKIQKGRLVVRYSGTENYIRIMAEDPDENNIKKVVQDLAQKLKNLLS